jgi:NAD(P)-dependent dehydrogenase (short-subunit alcohol dehydrogenase family)
MQLAKEVVQQSSPARRGECEIHPQDPNTLVNVRSGKAIAIRLANDGYDVCINDIPANKSGCDQVVKEIQNLGRKSFAYTADVSNLKEVQGLVQASVEELGPLNTMVANAGIAQVKALLDLTPDDLSRMFQVNGIAERPGS